MWNTDGDPTQSQLHHDFDLVGSGQEDKSFVMFGAGASDLGTLPRGIDLIWHNSKYGTSATFPGEILEDKFIDNALVLHYVISDFDTALLERFHSSDVLIE